MRSLSSLLRRVRDCIEANDLWLIHGLAVAKAQRTTFISHTIAVVRGAEHSNTLIPMLEAYPIILNFMRPHQKIQIVLSKELLSNTFTKSKGSSSGAYAEIPYMQSRILTFRFKDSIDDCFINIWCT